MSPRYSNVTASIRGYDYTIYQNPYGTSRSCQIKNKRERERARDQTHSYWYIPSAPRVNYSLLVMESAGMMKMASGEGFPLR